MLRLPDWQADWNAGMALLARHARNGGEPAEEPLQGYAALEHAYGWEAVAQTGSNLLLKGIDRGFAPTALQQMHADVTDLWLEDAHLLAIARDSLQQQGHDIALAAPLQPRTTQHYEYALQLLSLGVLLDVQDRLPALVEQVLCFETDRVLDYLSAPALGLAKPAMRYSIRARSPSCSRHCATVKRSTLHCWPATCRCSTATSSCCRPKPRSGPDA